MEPKYKVGDWVCFMRDDEFDYECQILDITPETDIHADEYHILVDGKDAWAYEGDLYLANCPECDGECVVCVSWDSEYECNREDVCPECDGDGYKKG